MSQHGRHDGCILFSSFVCRGEGWAGTDRSKGVPGTRTPFQFIFFHFHGVFGKFLVPLHLRLPPPRLNPPLDRSKKGTKRNLWSANSSFRWKRTWKWIVSTLIRVQEDKSGKLGYEEFKKLWADLRTWKVRFGCLSMSRRIHALNCLEITRILKIVYNLI